MKLPLKPESVGAGTVTAPGGMRANFALVLKRWRLEHRIPQKKLAADLGYAKTTVSAWETGERFPDGFALEVIARYTRLTPCRLFCHRSARCAPEQCALLTGRA
ncbi:MAG: helix-turn-helix transcriptional regulator [Verrucomicrobiota bacterium]